MGAIEPENSPKGEELFTREAQKLKTACEGLDRKQPGVWEAELECAIEWYGFVAKAIEDRDGSRKKALLRKVGEVETDSPSTIATELSYWIRKWATEGSTD